MVFVTNAYRRNWRADSRWYASSVSRDPPNSSAVGSILPRVSAETSASDSPSPVIASITCRISHQCEAVCDARACCPRHWTRAAGTGINHRSCEAGRDGRKSLKESVNRNALPRHTRVVPKERYTHSHGTDGSDIGLNPVGKVNFNEAAPRLDAKMLAYPESPRAARGRLQSSH